MAYVVVGRSSRAAERVSYEDERDYRSSESSSGRRFKRVDRRDRDDDDRLDIRTREPIRVKVEEKEEKEPGFVKTVAKNGGKLVATGVGIAGFGTFWYGAFQAMAGSHHVPGVGHFPTAGVSPGGLMGVGVVAMLGAGALWHWLNPKK